MLRLIRGVWQLKRQGRPLSAEKDVKHGFSIFSVIGKNTSGPKIFQWSIVNPSTMNQFEQKAFRVIIIIIIIIIIISQPDPGHDPISHKNGKPI